MAGPYFVDVTTGNDADDGLSEGDAFATLEKAADTIAAGETVNVKASANYVVQDGANDSVLNLSTAGTAGSPVFWEGYTTSPGDGGTVTIDANTNTLANCVNSAGAQHYQSFKNFRFTGASAIGVDLTTEDNMYFENCRFDTNGTLGVWTDNNCIYYKCQADNNGANGILSDVGTFVGCLIFDNSDRGLQGLFGSTMLYCVAYGNTTAQITTNATQSVVLGCSVDGENATIGIHQDNAAGVGSVFLNNILYDCATGISSDGDVAPAALSDHNLFFDNATDRTNIVTGDNDVAGSEDPYTDSANADYTLKANSEAEDAGFDRGSA